MRAERFLREIQISAQLSHPHILPLHDSGEAGGIVYYVMPYVDGESLRERLIREKQLPIEDALAIARDVATALGHAHARGVVHRDVKPENILLTRDGKPVVMDFGIARALEVAGGQTVTEPGIAVGTPAYMSPEQASGAEVDARSDIYSLGCVLYELLAGHPPFTGTTAQEVLSRHTLDPVPSIRAARRAVPEQVERVVMKALAKQPADRFATATQFGNSLTTSTRAPARVSRTLKFAVGILALLFVAGGLVARRFRINPLTEQSLAVLPCVPLSNDTTAQYFADGMTEDLINKLLRIPGLRLPGYASSRHFKGEHRNLAALADSLHVRHLLECTVRRAGSQLRVGVQLMNARSGRATWGETYTRELDSPADIFRLQDGIARDVAGQLRISLAGVDSTRPQRPYTEDMAAYDWYLLGRHYWYQRTAAGLAKAIQYFKRAVEQDSMYALSYSGLSDAYAEAALRGSMLPREAYARAETAAIRALELNDSLAEGHAALGKVRALYRWDLKGAEQEFRRAIALNTTYAFAHSWYGVWALSPMGRHDEAIREASLGVQLEPLEHSTRQMLGASFYFARRYDDAIEQFRTVVRIAPEELVRVHVWLGRAAVAKGLYQEALAAFQDAAAVNPQGAVWRGWVAFVHASSGRQGEAFKILTELEGLEKTENTWVALARVHTGLGHMRQAVDALEAWFQSASADQNLGLNAREVLLDATFDPLREDPRFRQIVRAMGEQG